MHLFKDTPFVKETFLVLPGARGINPGTAGLKVFVFSFIFLESNRPTIPQKC